MFTFAKKMKEMDDKELLLTLKTGNRQSFTVLYNQYWSQVYNFSRLYLTSRDAAEEVVQEVFVKVWESREFIREDDNFKGLLFIITRNLIFNQSRKSFNEDFYKITMLAAMEQSYDMEAEIDAKNLREYIDQLIADLPPQRKLIFTMSRNENMSYKEIAEKLSISEKTVENQISSAIKYLKQNLILLSSFLLMQ